MGFGLPAALGAAVAYDGTDSGREKRVSYLQAGSGVALLACVVGLHRQPRQDPGACALACSLHLCCSKEQWHRLHSKGEMFLIGNKFANVIQQRSV